jgi:glutamine amidotransferase
MCELFAFSAKFPSELKLSLKEFVCQAGQRNPDGWGIAYCDGNTMALTRIPEAAYSSAVAQRLATDGITSTCVISHVRKATVGGINLNNTHPFTRTVDEGPGKGQHLFAFNGNVPQLFQSNWHPGNFILHGDTDAELAVGCILERIHKLETYDIYAIASILQGFGSWLSTMGPANFLYHHRDMLYVFASRRRHHDGFHPPGLWFLQRRCRETVPTTMSGTGFSFDMGKQRAQQVVLIASIPLTNEVRHPFRNNELMVVHHGNIHERLI